ncbi:MAG: TraR/DksA C4-type zinc finger protein [Clostridia bacterium]|nr:TraR/DksA C4-type zinc finger protein [Clostridia bacterium]
MDQKRLNYLKGILEEELENKERLVSSMEKNFPKTSLKEEFGELSSYDNHPADLASETTVVEENHALKDSEKRQIKEINDALLKLEKGNYGICEICGGEIFFERLKEIPETRLCLQCEHDRQDNPSLKKQVRPVEEEVIAHPFGRSFRDNTQETGFDGEDAWQELQRYGSSSGPQDLSGEEGYDETYIDSEEDVGIVEKVEKYRSDRDK